MKVSLNMNAVNQIPEGSVIYEKDEPLKSVSLVLRGRVLVQADGIQTVFSSGNFLGAWDIDYLTHSFTYTAKDNVVLYTCAIKGNGDFERLLSSKPEYRGLLNTSLNYFIVEINRTYLKLQVACKELREFVLAQYRAYIKEGHANGVPTVKMSSIAPLERIKVEDISLCKELDYYLACAKMSIPAQKNYYEGSELVSQLHFQQQKECLFSLLIECKRYTDALMRCFRVLILDERNIFSQYTRLAVELANIGVSNASCIKAVDEIVEKINSTETFLTSKCGITVALDRDLMEKMYYALISGDSYEEKVQVTESKVVSNLQNALDQILEYDANTDNEKKVEFGEAIKAFSALRERFSRSDDAVIIRKAITKHFYEIYESILLKSFQDPNPPVAVRLFLEYGFVSETLVTNQELETLISIENRSEIGGNIHVYTMAKWLRMIYTLEKEPSKNEFDMDYTENLRYEKKTGIITEEQERMFVNNPKERLHFEIQNVFRYASRLIDGRISVFVPVLTSDSLLLPVAKTYLSSDKCKSVINKIKHVDPFIFYRERRVAYEKVNISNEDIVSEQLPDIILFPLCGQNGMMWQDITGKNRSSKGRFFFPQLMQGNLETEMLKVLAHFRWEKCRTEQGMQWNNLHYPSLTSEYTDYLQFYRKNMDLSPEAKTKVKAQLVQCNNRHKDLFAKDYQDWISRESTGAMKLNKVARGILYTYCPFSLEIRKKLMDATPYAEASKRFTHNMGKRKHDLEISCGKFKRAGMDLPLELQETWKLYNEL